MVTFTKTRVGVIDIGSNTIKAYIFDCGERVSPLGGKSIAAKLLNYTSGGVLSEAGFAVVENAVCELMDFCRENGCDKIWSLATSAVRDCENAYELTRRVKLRFGLQIQVLSGDQEALCDCTRARQVLSGTRALCIDMGGGSAQLSEFEGERIYRSHSFQLGALRMKNAFFAGILPTPEEEARLRAHVDGELALQGFTKSGLIAAVMGGTSATAQRIFAALALTDSDCDSFRTGLFGQVVKKLVALSEEEARSFLTKHTPNRAEIIAAGYIILDEILCFCGCECFTIITGGVREGFLELKLSEKI